MIKFTIISGVALLLSVSMGSHGANAQESLLAGPSTKSYLACAKQCEKTFYFSEQSDSNFAGLRNACIEGCASVVDANMTAYQSCNVGCQGIYPYRHGTNAEFAGLSKILRRRLQAGSLSPMAAGKRAEQT